MPNHLNSKLTDKPKDPPAPEELRAQSDDGSPALETSTSSTAHNKVNLKLHRSVYRPTHKATFIGLSVVIAILAVNAGAIFFLMNAQNKPSNSVQQSDMTISPSVLDTLGTSRNSIGNSGTELVVKPNSTFDGKITVSGEASISGQLKLNSKLTGTEASLSKLTAGDTSLAQLNVSGDGTLTNLNLRKDLTVIGSTKLQGAVTVSQLFTVANNMSVSGSLAVGGVLSARSFQANNLTSDTVLTVGGHIVTGGSAPGYSAGGALGSNGTVGLSGNDAAGTISVNFGTGGGNGLLASVTFLNPYTNIPHIVVTPIGCGINVYIISRSRTGFSIGTSSSISSIGCGFDYIVMQ